MVAASSTSTQAKQRSLRVPAPRRDEVGAPTMKQRVERRTAPHPPPQGPRRCKLSPCALGSMGRTCAKRFPPVPHLLSHTTSPLFALPLRWRGPPSNFGLAVRLCALRSQPSTQHA